MSAKAKKWVLVKEFVGDASLENFQLVEETLSTELKEGEVQVEALFWSVDPYMRVWAHTDESGEAMMGYQVGVVTTSKSKKYPKGSHVIGNLGWRTHTNVHEDQIEMMPEIGSYPMSLALGILGLTGMTAYFGVYDILNLKPGEILVVTTAAGAVGNVVGQIGKILGCTVIGFCGSDEKCAWLKEELHFDHVFNYKKTSLEDALKMSAPDGVDCYFDNVGGEFCGKMVSHMKLYGRIACCRSISTYQTEEPKVPYPYKDINWKRLRLEGYIITDIMDKWAEGRKQMLKWLQNGKMKNRDCITEGFEKMPDAFLDLFKGTNIGKAIFKA